MELLVVPLVLLVVLMLGAAPLAIYALWRQGKLGQRDVDPPEGSGHDQSKDGGAILHTTMMGDHVRKPPRSCPYI